MAEGALPDRARRLIEAHGAPLPDPETLAAWDRDLAVREHRPRERFLRRRVSPVLARLPAGLRLALTGVAKRLRNPKAGIPLRTDAVPAIDGWLARHDATPPTFCFTADVDNRLGYDWLGEFLGTVERAGVRVTVLLVTHYDYLPDVAWLSSLPEDRVEIGLHCYDHDIGLAYRSAAAIERKLGRALERLPPGVVSYRSAALSISETLLAVLARLGIRIDSSASSHCTFYPSVPTTRPYDYVSPAIRELPLVLQDDHFFRDARLSESEALAALDRFLAWLRASGSSCTLNFHPHNMRSRPAFLAGSLELLKTHYGAAASRTMSDYLR